MPIHKDGKVVGVYGVDISIYWLTKIIYEQRPLPYVTGSLMTHTGAFVIHPDTSLLRPRAMFTLMEQYPEEKYSLTAYKMMNGQSGTEQLSLNGTPRVLAYKPFEKTKWEITVACPEDEIMGNYNTMIPLMFAVVLLSLIAIVVFCSVFIHRELHPLRALEKSARLIKSGHYDVPIKTSNRQDEVGVLANSFITMQQSIRHHLDEIDHKNLMLVEQNWLLTEAQKHKTEADRVKMAFLQNMTDQMDEPVNEISRLVTEVRQHHHEMPHEQIVELANQVDAHTFTVTQLLDKLLEVATKNQEEEDEA